MAKFEIECRQSNFFTFDTEDLDFKDWLTENEIPEAGVDADIIVEYISEMLESDIDTFGSFDGPDIEVKKLEEKK